MPACWISPLAYRCFVLCLFCLAPALARAEVVRMEVDERIPFADGYSFEHTGPYERLRGRMIVEVDPDAACNSRVHDLKYAARNEQGKVEFWTDFVLLKPVDPGRGNGRILYDVHNRGNMLAVWTFNSADKITNDPRTLEDGGNGFLMRQGYSVLWTGWNAEVQEDGLQRLLLGAPVIRNRDAPLTGKVHVEICVSEKMMSRSFGWSPWGMPKVFPTITLDNRQATLTMRPLRSEPAVEIPHSDWAFARWEDGKVIPDPTQLYVKGGFQPGWLYDLVYTAKDPRVAGVGLAGIRDVVSFLRNAQQDQSGNANPLLGAIDKAYIFGISQSGRLAVSFLHEGYNADPNGKQVFDGALVHVAGAGKGHFAVRFRTATDTGTQHEANWSGAESFPFSPTVQTDPETGETGSVLDRAQQAGVVPKIIYVQTSTEYWSRAASLLHTNVEGTQDVDLPENVRLYLTAGAQHLGKGEPTKGFAQQPRNILDDRGPVLRAMLVVLDRWTTVDELPPPSRYPTIANGGLIDIDTFRQQFPELPGVNLPQGYYRPVRLDFGPRLVSAGIADIVPPQVGEPWKTLVPAVNQDGNEFHGLVLPDVAAPLGTYTGWNLRDKQYGPPEMLTPLDGMYLPFATTAEERKQTGDPRLSVRERYPTRNDYMAKITDATLQLEQQRFLLPEDAVQILEIASQRNFWDN